MLQSSLAGQCRRCERPSRSSRARVRSARQSFPPREWTRANIEIHWRAASAASVANPLPRQERRMTHPSSRPGQPSGFHRPTRPITCPVDFSATAHEPYPRSCQCPIIIAMFRQATVIPPGEAPSRIYLMTSGSWWISRKGSASDSCIGRSRSRGVSTVVIDAWRASTSGCLAPCRS